MQIHGGISGEELQRVDRKIVDFSVSVNPVAPWPIVRSIKDINRYPSRISYRLREIVSNFYSIDIERVVPLGGATEGIYLLPFFYSTPAALFPVYGDYLDAFSREGVEVKEFKTLPTLYDGDLFLIVNPQNPTGEYIQPQDIISFANRNSRVTIVVDEAYQEMGVGCESCINLNTPDNIVVLRSLTKSSGWPSLRAGFFVASRDNAEMFVGRVLPWQITSQQLQLIEYYYNMYSSFNDTWNYYNQLKNELVDALSRLPLKILDGKAPFITFRIDNRVDLQSTLFDKYGILIRDCSSFGLKGYYRVMAQSTDENRLLVRSLGELL